MIDKQDYTILYAEDESGVRKNMSEYLKIYYTNIIEASDGELAYTLYKEHKPDFIITDLKMPKVDGLEFIKKVREEDKDIPIIAISAIAENENLLEAIKLGLCEYIIKPIDRANLRNALTHAIEKSDFNNVDALTSLKNRRAADKEFNKIIYRKKTHNEYSGAIFIDISSQEDHIIKQISVTLSQNTRQKDILIRWSEDKFLILLLDIDFDDAITLANKLKEKLLSTISEDIICTFSISEIKEDDTINDVIARAKNI